MALANDLPLRSATRRIDTPTSRSVPRGHETDDVDSVITPLLS